MVSLAGLRARIIGMLTLMFITLGVTITKAEEGVCTKKSCDEPNFIGNFHIPTQPLPRLKVNDAEARERLKNGFPVVLTDTGIFKTEEPWSLDFLERAFRGSPVNWKVSKSHNRHFMYYKGDTNYANYKFTPPYTNAPMKFSEFVKSARQMEKEGGSGRLYLKSTLYVPNKDKLKFEFNIDADSFVRNLRGSGEPAAEPVIYIGMKDVVTPMHFDYNENMIVQVYGRKRCILVSPEHYSDLYPYPLGHPHDRQSRVDMENPDYNRFPRFKNVTGYEAILSPGDALLLPTFWWHLVESEHHSETVSLGFSDHSKEAKFRDQIFSSTGMPGESRPDGAVVYQTKEMQEEIHESLKSRFNSKAPVYFSRPFDTKQQIHMKRVIEQMIAESTGNYREVGPILKELYERRYEDFEFNEK